MVGLMEVIGRGIAETGRTSKGNGLLDCDFGKLAKLTGDGGTVRSGFGSMRGSRRGRGKGGRSGMDIGYGIWDMI